MDYGADGQPIGIEITAPEAVSRDRLNAVLESLGEAPLPELEFRPLTAAA